MANNPNSKQPPAKTPKPKQIFQPNDLGNSTYERAREMGRAKMARERRDHTLQGTALVHEAILKAGARSGRSREIYIQHLAKAMRDVLADHGRKKGAVKRGGSNGGSARPRGRADIEPDALPAKQDVGLFDTEAAEAAIRDLEANRPDLARVLYMRHVQSLKWEEVAAILGVSVDSAQRWAKEAERILQKQVEESIADSAVTLTRNRSFKPRSKAINLLEPRPALAFRGACDQSREA